MVVRVNVGEAGPRDAGYARSRAGSVMVCKLALALSALMALSACGAPGPMYRGAPPPGMTDAEYRCKMDRAQCPVQMRWPDMKDAPGTGTGDAK